jgi:hypothetical protein
MPNGHNAESKKGQIGHNVEWEKTPNGNHVESKKGRLGQNVEWYKENVKSKQYRIRRHTVMSKRVKNVESKEIYLKCCYLLKKLLDTTMNNNVENGQMDTNTDKDMHVDMDMGRSRCFSTFFPFNIFCHQWACFFPFNVLSRSHFFHSAFFPFGVSYYSTFCPSRCFYHFTFCPIRRFFHLTFCPIRRFVFQRFVVQRFVLSSFVTSTFCR